MEGPWEYGDEPQQGKRSDLAAIKAAIDEGATVEDIADGWFADWCRYRQSFKEYALLRQTKRNWQTTVTVYWGPSGTGKTRRAAYEAGPDAYWLNNTGGNVLWWDGYTGQSTVVIDEFYGWIKYTDMLRLVDRYPYAVQVSRAAPSMSTLRKCIVLIGLTSQVRGASVNFVAKHIIITSNKPPHQWWAAGLQAMERRLEPPIGTIVEMLMGLWEPPASSVPLPPSSGPLRAPTPTLTSISSGLSMSLATCAIPSVAAPSSSGGVVSAMDATMMDAFATSSTRASTTTGLMEMPSPPSSPRSPTWRTTRLMRTPSPSARWRSTIETTTTQSATRDSPPPCLIGDWMWWNHN